ncbi:hypothetical protein ABZP36_015109 [Zizania latifolia]
MAATTVDVKELPGAYAFMVDMPGLKSDDIKVQVEEDRVLRMERRMGKFMPKFMLPDNADMDKISAIY